MLKHHGKKEVLCLINQMEDCFDHPFKFDPEAIDSARKARGTSAVEHGQWGYGINVYRKRRYQSKATEKSTLNMVMYGFQSDEEYARVQDYLQSHGNYQLEAESICPHSLVKAITSRVVTFLVFWSNIVIILSVMST